MIRYYRKFVSPLIVIIALSLSCFFCISCQKEATVDKPNIVWITSEDNSVHYMKLYNKTGAPTPNIEMLAQHGVTCLNAYSNAPVCSVARSTIISGCYAPRIGAEYHRRMKKVPMPDGLEMFPAYLKKAGYYTTNNNKEDYNIIKGKQVWDESSKKAHWRNRSENQPFFHVFNIGDTHESRLHFSREKMETYQPLTPIDTACIFPEHPKTELFAYTNAYYRDKVMQMDSILGEVVEELKNDGLLESTFIFYYGDHGGVLPGSKGYIYETGLHVPMVIYIPEKYKDLVDFKPGSKIEGLVSFVDLAPTVLNLAGINIPEGIDGKPFLGKNIKAKEVNKRDETYGYADRFDEKYDFVRSLRKGKYKYIRSYQPFNFDGLRNNYRYRQLAYQEWLSLYEEEKLNDIQSRFFETRPPEMLFDLESDPNETTNLAEEPGYGSILKEMRNRLNAIETNMPDLSFIPEKTFVANGIENPVLYGQKKKDHIAKYLEIANLQLEPFETARGELETALYSADPWQRYWALITCSTFAKKDEVLLKLAEKISKKDPELLNKTRAAEYLAISNNTSPVDIMTKALYSSQDEIEALLILNSIVLMQDGKYNFQFDINPEFLSEKVKNNPVVMNRINYLSGKMGF